MLKLASFLDNVSRIKTYGKKEREDLPNDSLDAYFEGLTPMTVSYTHLSQNAGGVLFNLQGQVIGIITNSKSATDMKNMVCAYGITELKRHIEKMSNGEKFAYLGLKLSLIHI